MEKIAGNRPEASWEFLPRDAIHSQCRDSAGRKSARTGAQETDAVLASSSAFATLVLFLFHFTPARIRLLAHRCS